MRHGWRVRDTIRSTLRTIQFEIVIFERSNIADSQFCAVPPACASVPSPDLPSLFSRSTRRSFKMLSQNWLRRWHESWPFPAMTHDQVLRMERLSWNHKFFHRHVFTLLLSIKSRSYRRFCNCGRMPILFQFVPTAPCTTSTSSYDAPT